LDWFLGSHKLQLQKRDKQEEKDSDQSLSNYQRAVMLLIQKKQVVRVIVAMTTLIKKVHLYEVMNKLGQNLERLDIFMIVKEMDFCSTFKLEGG